MNKNKVYKATSRVSKSLREAIKNTLDYHEKFRGCYFWTNTGNAAYRRHLEEKFAGNNPHYSIETGKGMVHVEPTLSINCNNFYYSLNVSLDGEKKTIRLLKGIIL